MFVPFKSQVSENNAILQDDAAAHDKIRVDHPRANKLAISICCRCPSEAGSAQDRREPFLPSQTRRASSPAEIAWVDSEEVNWRPLQGESGSLPE